MYSCCDERSATFPYEIWLKRPGGSSAIRLNTVSIRRKENHPLVFCVCETRNYKYFAGVCRGFLAFAEEKNKTRTSPKNSGLGAGTYGQKVLDSFFLFSRSVSEYSTVNR